MTKLKQTYEAILKKSVKEALIPVGTEGQTDWQNRTEAKIPGEVLLAETVDTDLCFGTSKS